MEGYVRRSFYIESTQSCDWGSKITLDNACYSVMIDKTNH